MSTKKTIVFFSVDALGHISPQLPIIQELCRRGHRAVIMTVRPLSSSLKLRDKGVELIACTGDSSVEKSESQSEEVMIALMKPLAERFRLGPMKSFEATYSLGGACDKHLQDMIDHHDAIEEKLRSLKPDLIVFDHIIGVPCATYVAPKWVRVYGSFPAVLFANYNENFVAGLGLRFDEMTPEMRQFALGVRKLMSDRVKEFFRGKPETKWCGDFDLVPTSPYLNLYLGPDELGLERVPSLKSLPDYWVKLEHTVQETDKSEGFEIPENLRDLPGKLIYFSLGTLVTSDIDLMNRLLEFLSKSPNRFIVSKGPLHRHIKMYPNMWGDKFVNQRAILPKVDLFITHGGHNSIVESFYYGVPGLLVLPVFADQFDSAQRIQDCNYGIRLDPYNCTQKELNESIDCLLNNKKLADEMRAIGDRLRSINYVDKAANLLEGLTKE